MESSLRTSEISVAIQARIEDLSLQQVAVVNRLRDLGVPENLLEPAMCAKADSEASKAAEDAIIAWCAEHWAIGEPDVLRVLNGKNTLDEVKAVQGVAQLFAENSQNSVDTEFLFYLK